MARDACDSEVSAKIFEFIEHLVREEGRIIAPYQINCGMCDEMAQYVEERVPGSRMIWLEDEFEDLQDLAHAVVVYNGRYYDAECPCGVMDVHELPAVKYHGDVKYHRKMRDLYIWPGEQCNAKRCL